MLINNDVQMEYVYLKPNFSSLLINIEVKKEGMKGNTS